MAAINGDPKRFGLGARLIFAAADNAGGFKVELGEIGACFPIVGREFDGAFEFRANFLGETGRAHKTCVIRLFAVDSTQPQMIETVMRIESDGFFAGRNSGVPRSQFEVSAAEQIVSLRRGRALRICRCSVSKA